ncbi:DUF3667 domain-containing protein [Flavobacterium sp. AG291]|uniref:DUF3667 domain-containing protein n=1 Tax=Flavobacterium sp. AG291 TaxID=2184000 RepID=UPI000E0BCB5D|nr:DUF3667 domain-containing protein [Flavobacterium sp. AG291]RDI05592.1 uncharacterized protein DUF3667 [Flavobacterium sp. AG291]
MGHHDLRHDRECQNCGHTVEVSYCSKCGQHNIETRQPFHHLITHTIEDITHYDSNFWKTIKYLLFRPGKLTTEYLLGHRMRYVPPVKLYIFISFVCFFLMAIMAPEGEQGKSLKEINIEQEKKQEQVLYESNLLSVENKKKKEGIKDDYGNVYTSVHQFDSIQHRLPENKKMSKAEYYLFRSIVKSYEGNFTTRDIIIAAAHTIPKILFIYMPLFAFWLWLFHGKKRWFFFDHGIFTLHYFSFLLLSITILYIVRWIDSHILPRNIADTISQLLTFAVLIYAFFYFFRAHSRFYCERKAISRLKSFCLFIINSLSIIVMILITFVYIFNNLH